MRGGSTRPAPILSRVLLVALLLLLSGCGMFLTTPPPDPQAWATVPAPAPEPAASEPELAAPPEVTSGPEENEARRAPRKPHRAPVRRRPPPPPPPPRPAPPPAPAPAPVVTTRTIDHGTYRTLLDAQVQRPDGKVIGHAVDLVAGPDGKPANIVVNLQGFMGIGDRKADFPWSTVRVDLHPKTPAITLVLGPHQMPAPDKPNAAGPGQAGPGDATPTRLPMLDSTVERPNGGKVGRVVDVLLGANADPLAVVLDVSGTLQTRHTIAADWSALHFAPRDNALRAQLDITDQQIDASPPYANDNPVRAVTRTPVVVPARAAPAPPAPPASPASSASSAPASGAK
jgi:hypothetical protein